MENLQIAEGDGLQIWRVGVNIMNKQFQTADNGQSSNFWVKGRELTTSHHKKPASYEMLHMAGSR
jgi:hypothetical protein